MQGNPKFDRKFELRIRSKQELDIDTIADVLAGFQLESFSLSFGKFVCKNDEGHREVDGMTTVGLFFTGEIEFDEAAYVRQLGAKLASELGVAAILLTVQPTITGVVRPDGTVIGDDSPVPEERIPASLTPVTE